jgi:hypothetical protein
MGSTTMGSTTMGSTTVGSTTMGSTSMVALMFQLRDMKTECLIELQTPPDVNASTLLQALGRGSVASTRRTWTMLESRSLRLLVWLPTIRCRATPTPPYARNSTSSEHVCHWAEVRRLKQTSASSCANVTPPTS